MGNESRLQKAFQNGDDIHQQTACDLFSCSPEQVTADMRRQAKIVNFGLIYGMSPFGLSQQLTVSVAEAKSIIDNYFSLYPEIAGYMDQCKEEARQKGYVSTLWGRRCYVPHINSPAYGLRAAAERQAINAPLQGTSADLMKRAMIAIHQWIQQSQSPFQLLLQVHDEVILEVPELSIHEAVNHLVPLMTSVASLTVPLKVNATWGHRWE
jgi:DNA polymerase-1